MTARLSALRGLRDNPWTLRVLILLLAAAFLTSLTVRFGSTSADAQKQYVVPQNATMEAKLGIRIAQAAVVGDGGLVEIRYTVLDAAKASAFQNNTKHPPVLYSKRDHGNAVYRTALMKQGHTLRAGQSYFILYENNHGAVRTGDSLEIDAGGGKLLNVPVR